MHVAVGAGTKLSWTLNSVPLIPFALHGKQTTQTNKTTKKQTTAKTKPREGSVRWAAELPLSISQLTLLQVALGLGCRGPAPPTLRSLRRGVSAAEILVFEQVLTAPSC